MGFNSGYQFSTGNSVVRQLPVGTTLVVSGQGQLQIDELPVQSFQAGDRIQTKYGPGTVVRITSTADLDSIVEANLDEDFITYIADGHPVLRVARRDAISRL